MKPIFVLFLFGLFVYLGCHSGLPESNQATHSGENDNTYEQNTPSNPEPTSPNAASFDTSFKTIHVFVALCDNTYQGIVPVPKAIGNGQDPNTNLYWGCGYGIRTYFKKSKEWKLVKTIQQDSLVLERLIFKHISKKYYLVADAYDGRYIEKCTRDFFASNAGQKKDTLKLLPETIGMYGNAQLCAYIGHNGLMDFSIEDDYKNSDGRSRDAIILACMSKRYFSFYMQQSETNPVVWTTNFMAPEAYTLHDALSGYVLGETDEQIRTRAAAAYARYQKCSLKAAKGLLVSGY